MKTFFPAAAAAAALGASVAAGDIGDIGCFCGDKSTGLPSLVTIADGYRRRLLYHQRCLSDDGSGMEGLRPKTTVGYGALWGHNAMGNMPWALCHGHCAMGIMPWALWGHCAMGIVPWVQGPWV